MSIEEKAIRLQVFECEKEISRLKGKVIAIEVKIELLTTKRNDYKKILGQMEAGK